VWLLLPFAHGAPSLEHEAHVEPLLLPVAHGAPVPAHGAQLAAMYCCPVFVAVARERRCE
ncbi:hypothetical protein A2U01_0027450, partial [Trifolium medium]|nr:hypothetical protein [Trifolium medium]